MIALLFLEVIMRLLINNSNKILGIALREQSIVCFNSNYDPPDHERSAFFGIALSAIGNSDWAIIGV
jgi:hypothetical protein